MTLRDILNARNGVTEPKIVATKKPALSPIATENIERLVGSMNDLEKEVAVHKIPTEILMNEIVRRSIRDEEDLKGIKAIIDRREEY